MGDSQGSANWLGVLYPGLRERSTLRNRPMVYIATPPYCPYEGGRFLVSAGHIRNCWRRKEALDTNDQVRYNGAT